MKWLTAKKQGIWICDIEEDKKLRRNGKMARIPAEVVEYIKKSIDKAVKENAAIFKEKRNYYRDTEKLLYSYPDLKIKVAQDEEDIKNGIFAYREKSSDVIRCGKPTDPAVMENRETQYTLGRAASLDRTKAEIMRLERALETITDDKYYEIIPLKYWDNLQPCDIARQMYCDESTYYRNKGRLVKKIACIIFGADAV